MNKLLITIAAAGLTLSSAAIAQDAPAPNNDQPADQNPITFESADADHSGGVNLEEAQLVWPDVTQEQFTTADANADGSLDQVEFQALASTLQMSSSQSTTSGDSNSTNNMSSGNGSTTTQ